MEILVIGTDTQIDETKRKFGSGHRYAAARERKQVPPGTDIVFDFLNDASPDLRIYNNCSAVLFVNSVFTTLKQLNVADLRCNVFGFCGLQTFVDRPIFEVTLHAEQQNEYLLSVCARLDTEYRVVPDSVGMITPRVICMIINEAYFTVQEGTATREDIDLAMKLGTNYPYGPFEWCDRIGKQNVVRLLAAVHAATNDSRYEIASLMAS